MRPREAIAKGPLPERLTRALVLAAYGGFCLWLLISGKSNRIIHPRVAQGLAIAACIALLMAVAEFRARKRPRSSGGGITRYLAVFLAMGGALAFLRLDESASLDSRLSPEARAFSQAIQQGQGTLAKGSPPERGADQSDFANPIVLDDQNYWSLYNRIFDSPKEAQGKAIQVSGFTFRNPGLSGAQVFVARNLMWCCAADMSVIGFPLRGNGCEGLSDGLWIRVRGHIDFRAEPWSGDEGDEPVPFVSVDGIDFPPRAESTTIFPR